MKKNFMESLVCKRNPLYSKKNATYIVGKQYLDHEKYVFSDDIGVWVKLKTKSFNFGKWESEFERISDNESEFYEERTKVIRHMHYLETSIGFYRVIVYAEESNFIFMQCYFDKEEHNFKTNLPHGRSKTNFQSHKRTKESKLRSEKLFQCRKML